MSEPAGVIAAVYLDEEECLGIDVFVNELELLVATARQLGRVDQAQLLELLPKLAATTVQAGTGTTGPEAKARLKALQKRCEPAFTELIAAGVCQTVRRLICVCLTRFYVHADMLTIYARVSSLQSALSAKEPPPTPGGRPAASTDAVRVGMLEVLAYLCLHHGRYLSSAAGENMAIASRCVTKSSASRAIRVAGLRLAAATVAGMHTADRGAQAAQADAWALCLRMTRERGVCSETRAASVALLSAIARGGGAALWKDGGYLWEEAVRVAAGALSDAAPGVRAAAAAALADLATAPRTQHEALAAAVRVDAGRGGSRKAALDRLTADSGAAALRIALQQPLVDTALSDRADAVAALAAAWASGYIPAVLHAAPPEQSNGAAAAPPASASQLLVEIAMQVVLTCDMAATALIDRGPEGTPGLGAALAGGEIPPIQAAALYVLRSAVVDAMDEAAQRALLAKLVALLARPACPVPTAVVALEGLALLLDALGEVGADEGEATGNGETDETGGGGLEAVILTQTTSASAPVRHAAAGAAAAFAAACDTPARLLARLLDSLDAATELLGGVKPPGLRQAVSAGAAEAYDALMGRPQHALMATAHGAALAAAAVLLIAPRLPLSVPSALPRRAFALAARLVHAPNTAAAGATAFAPRALEREAGYIVLGAAIAAWGDVALGEDGTGDAIVDCLAVALGDAARRDLDEQIHSHPRGDGDMAMELWWRSVALQAVRAHLSHLVAPGRVKDPGAHEQRIADLVAPLLITVDCQTCMYDPAKAKGGPAGLLAACSATFLLRLLEVVQVLDVTRLAPATQSLLLKLVTKPVRAASIAAGGGSSLAAAQNMSPAAVAAATGYSPGLAAAFHRTALRACLPTEDAALGPWPAGREPAEDELHAYSGERGAPHRQPWEPPLLVALFGDAAEASQALQATQQHQSLYPQPVGLAAGLLAAQAATLGRLLGSMSPGVQLTILDDLIAAAVAGKAGVAGAGTVPTDREARARRNAASALVSVAALSGLGPLARGKRGHGGAGAGAGGDKVAEKVLQLANALLDGGGATEPGIARAAAQLMAISACIGGADVGIVPNGSDVPATPSAPWGVKVVGAIVEEVGRSVAEEGRDPERRAALCLALGAIHRAQGGLALRSLLPASVGALLAALSKARSAGSSHAAAASATAAAAALHALRLCAGAAGAGYLPHVRATLRLCQELIVVGVDGAGVVDTAAAAALANAMVGVLGPEFTPGSEAYRIAKSLTSDLVAAGVHVAAGEESGSVLSLALAAGATPRATSPAALAAELQAVLFVQQASLFAPSAVRPGRHVPMLRRTLTAASRTLRAAAAATLFYLSERGGSDDALRASRAERALFTALDAEPPSSAIAAHLRGTLTNLLDAGAATEPEHWLELLSEVVFGVGAVAENGGAGDDRPPLALRLRTRLFGADLLLGLVRALAGSGGGRQDSSAGTRLLPQLVDAGYKLATGATAALRPPGVALLDALLDAFGAVEDPLLPGARLLEQYQAQVVSALRAALAPGVGPRLAMAGGALAATFLAAGLASGDGGATLARLMDLLAAALPTDEDETQGAGEQLHAEWVSALQRVALLHAHAQCAVLARAGGDVGEVVERAHAPLRPRLLAQWCALLAAAPGSAKSNEAVRVAHAAAVPAMLDAATAYLLPPSDADETDAATHCQLVSVTLSMLEDGKHQNTAVSALSRLLAADYVAAPGFVTGAQLSTALAALTARVMVRGRKDAGVVVALADVVREVAQGAPADQLPVAPLLAAILAVASITTPFEGQAGGSGALAPAASDVPHDPTIDQALVSVLVAGAVVVRKRPDTSVVAPLLRLALRLLSTAPRGVQLQAAQRFFVGVVAAAPASDATGVALAALVNNAAARAADDVTASAAIATLVASAATQLARLPELSRSLVLDALAGVLRQAGDGAADASLQAWQRFQAAADALRASLQQQQQQHAASPSINELLAVLGPPLVATTHAAIRACDQPAAAEAGLKALLAAAYVAAGGGAGSAPAEAVLAVLADLLVEAAGSAVGSTADLALKLLTSLPGSPSLGTPFRAVVGRLPASSKAALAAALQAQAQREREEQAARVASAAAKGAVRASAGAGIQLKTTFF